MTTGKTIALNIQTFISKVMALPFNMLSRFVIVFFQFNLFSSFSSVTLSCMTLWTIWPAACQASLFITNSWSYSNSCPLSQWCHPTISSSVFPSPPAFNLSDWSIRAFSDESVLHIRWANYWSFSLSISPCNKYSWLISSQMDWLDLLAVQGTLKSLLQHHSSKASVVQCSTFFIVQLLHPYMTTGKAIALTRWTFVGKVISLLFTMLVIILLTESKHLYYSLFPMFLPLFSMKWWDQMP